MAKVTRQGIISIAKYLLVALALATVVVAIALFVNQRGEQARHQDATEVVTQNEGGTSTEQIAVDTPPETNTTNKPTENHSDDDDSTSPEELPVTGLNTFLYTIVVLGLLTLSTTHFFMSRRALHRSL